MHINTADKDDDSLMVTVTNNKKNYDRNYCKLLRLGNQRAAWGWGRRYYRGNCSITAVMGLIFVKEIVVIVGMGTVLTVIPR